jgi:hypothetical protein
MTIFAALLILSIVASLLYIALVTGGARRKCTGEQERNDAEQMAALAEMRRDG